MENLFNFEYNEVKLNNQDGTTSNFRQVFGLNGINIACPKDSYHIVKTEDLSNLGNAFITKGHEVNVFNHRHGETIGLIIDFGERPSKVGDCYYKLVVTVPNNGSGKGYLSIKQVRLICSNGMIGTKEVHKNNQIKIPHTFDYKASLKLMELSINYFIELVKEIENRDEKLNDTELNENEVMYHLNKWFFEHELPISQKNEMTLDEFRKILALEPETLKCINRYNELKDALKKEVEYNAKLNLNLSLYTVYATVTNYLTRRIEKSNSTAHNIVQTERNSQKLKYFLEYSK